jgi:hypothetical protein
VPDFLDEKKREIRERLKELRPLVDEAARLEAALRALDGVRAEPQAAPAAAPAPRRAPRPRGGGADGNGGSGGARRGRPKGSGPRAQEALELVRKRPGISIPEMAEAMGIAQNYLYRVLPGLQREGQVRKEGRGWHPMESAAAPAAAPAGDAPAEDASGSE